MSERTIQTIKNLLRKADDEGNDPYIALLEYRNTPITGLQESPAQLLMSRMLVEVEATYDLGPYLSFAREALDERDSVDEEWARPVPNNGPLGEAGGAFMSVLFNLQRWPINAVNPSNWIYSSKDIPRISQWELNELETVTRRYFDQDME